MKALYDRTTNTLTKDDGTKIPCDPSCREIWTDKQEVEEGKNFEVKYIYEPGESLRERVAVPLSPPMQEDKKGHWWCHECKKEVAPIEVTYDENHSVCGYSVFWHEPPVQEDAGLWKGFLSEIAHAHSQFHIDHNAVGFTKAAEILEDRIIELKSLYHLTKKQ